MNSKIGDSFKEAINNAFKFTRFYKRDKQTMLDTLKTKNRGSDTMSILPPIYEIAYEFLDETHDRLVLLYEDYKVDGVVTWVPSNGNYRFISFE